MNRYKTITSALLIVPALTLASTARAEFKCDAAQLRIDRIACEKAVEGPTALRQYIQRMRVIDSLHFYDYVDEARAREWVANKPARPAAPPRVLLADPIEQPRA